MTQATRNSDSTTTCFAWAAASKNMAKVFAQALECKYNVLVTHTCKEVGLPQAAADKGLKLLFCMQHHDYG